ncbi:hypothetical protein G6F54_013909 [Rhizopus delemar]|nr:hypothetical protein G6F54_013909 [Rhizopus delemar]
MDGADAGAIQYEAWVGRHADDVALPETPEGTDFLYSSGTTGLPKGVMQPYRAWNAGLSNQIASWALTRDDRYVVSAPITHGTGTYLLPVLACGGAHLLLDATSPSCAT